MPNTFYPSQEEFEDTIERKFQQVVAEKLPPLIRQATEKKYYTISEACELLDVSRRHLLYLRRSGQIGYVKQGKKIYFRREDLDEFFESNYIPKAED